MSKPGDLPRVPEDQIEAPTPKASELKPGERVTLTVINNIQVDEEGRAWVDASSRVSSIPLVPGLSMQAERTEKGFILWLDKTVKFTRGRLYKYKQYLPVVEIREASESEDEL